MTFEVVYPRMYGETSVSAHRASFTSGLSPHVRGNLVLLLVGAVVVGSIPACTGNLGTGRLQALGQGSIPACTGKPSTPVEVVGSYVVYPRMYGETMNCSTKRTCPTGLSPHVRGNLHGGRDAGRGGGSIPACTGKPDLHGRPAAAPRVYPRMYGETEIVMKYRIKQEGLSPHVRGNPRYTLARKVEKGSISACTGKPTAGPGSPRPFTVYPRMYGETPDFPTGRGDWWGLSPHVRGNLHGERLTERCRGSIPACTGKPNAKGDDVHDEGVYPRMYGETVARTRKKYSVPGLSPHVRGNLLFRLGHQGQAGSIPACTGKPATKRCSSSWSRVYPRMYGETTPTEQRAYWW